MITVNTDYLTPEALELIEQHERQHHRKPVAATL